MFIPRARVHRPTFTHNVQTGFDKLPVVQKERKKSEQRKKKNHPPRDLFFTQWRKETKPSRRCTIDVPPWDCESRMAMAKLNQKRSNFYSHTSRPAQFNSTGKCHSVIAANKPYRRWWTRIWTQSKHFKNNIFSFEPSLSSLCKIEMGIGLKTLFEFILHLCEHNFWTWYLVYEQEKNVFEVKFCVCVFFRLVTKLQFSRSILFYLWNDIFSI